MLCYGQVTTPLTKLNATIFKIYPESRNGQWWRVIIFDNKKSLLSYIKERDEEIGSRTYDESIEALTSAWKTYKGRKLVKKKQLGHILFYWNGFGTETVTHELGHAALFWAQANKIDPKKLYLNSGVARLNSAHERFCYALGRMSKQFWKRYYKIVDGAKTHTKSGSD